MTRALTLATLGQLHRPPGWLWVYCTRYQPLCQHHAPMALAPLIIRWGRATCCAQCARCTVCGRKGATLKHPGWKNGEVGGPQPTSVLFVLVADLTANLSRRESIRVDVCIDRVALQGGEQRVESGPVPGESLTGERQDLRGRDASGDGSRRTRACRSARRHGRRGGTVRRLAQPHVDRASGVLLTDVEVPLIDELRTDDRRSGSVGELVGKLID